MSDQLPHDLQIHILVRLPVKSLLRFQCVSKSWKSLFRSTAFISTHTNHNEGTNINYTHLVQGRLCWAGNGEETDFRPKFHQFDDSFSEFQKIEFSSPTFYEYFGEVLECRGLLLLTDRVGTFILLNPAVRMTLTLPRPFSGVPETTYNYSVHGFGFDPKSNDYKVVIMVYGQFPTRAEVFKLSTGAWETVRFMDDFHCVILPSNFQTFVNGASHWIGCHSTENLSKEELVVVLFHTSDEEFRMMKLPDVLTTVNQHLISPVVSGGFLSLIHYNRGDGFMSNVYASCCIWLMKDYGVIESWTKQCTIDLRGYGGLKRTFSFRNNRVQLLIETRRKGLVLYDLKTNRFIRLGIRTMVYNKLSLNTCIESLVLLDQVNVVPEYKTSSGKKMRLTKWFEKA